MDFPDPPYTLVDLFCGAGGLSYGFQLAGQFEVLLGVDSDPDAQETFIRNHSSAQFICEDLWELNIATVWDGLRRRGITQPGKLDVLLGGPPCEGFSQNRSIRRLDDGRVEYGGYDRWFDDRRNRLFVRFLEIADELKPIVILIENVPQLLTHRDGATKLEILERLESIGYAYTEPRVLLAADFGVPQLRRRAFILAYRPEFGFPFTLPRPTHRPPRDMDQVNLFEKPSADNAFPGDLGLYVTVREAIGDLPAPRDSDERLPVSNYPDTQMSSFRRLVRSPIATPANHVTRIPSERIRERLRLMRSGMRLDSLPEELRTKSWYFNSYGRLDWDQPAKTITKSCNYLGSGCFGHPDPTREHGITMREAARLQSFPDDFTFYSKSIPVQAKLIGSAVPPLLAAKIAAKVAHCLGRTRRSPVLHG